MLENIKNYSYKTHQEIFNLGVIAFNKHCSIHDSSKEHVDFYTILWIQDGKGEYQIDFKTYNFNGNTLVFLTPGQQFKVNSEAIQSAYIIRFIPDFYCIETHDKAIACNGVLFNNIYETPYIQPNSKEQQKLNFILETMIDEFEGDCSAKYDMLQSLLKQFMILAVRARKEQHQQLSSQDSQLFKDFSLLVEKNYKQLHRVTDYANRLGISPKSLSKHLQNLHKETPLELIQNRLILEAKRLLIYSEMSIKSIAFELGFEDPAYFSRFFKKHTGVSANSFKKELQPTN